MPAAVVWFGLGAVFCWLAERARRLAAAEDDFEDRLAALEDEADARGETAFETH